jgi:hypothetical protein
VERVQRPIGCGIESNTYYRAPSHERRIGRRHYALHRLSWRIRKETSKLTSLKTRMLTESSIGAIFPRRPPSANRLWCAAEPKDTRQRREEPAQTGCRSSMNERRAKNSMYGANRSHVQEHEPQGCADFHGRMVILGKAAAEKVILR